MKWGERVLRRFRAVARVEGFECEIKAELLFHIEMRTQDNIEAGMPPEQARADAIRRFGDVPKIDRLCRQARGASRAARLARAVTLASWPIAAAGAAVSLSSDAVASRHAGDLLIAIAVLSRVLVYARNAALYRPPPRGGGEGGSSRYLQID